MSEVAVVDVAKLVTQNENEPSRESMEELGKQFHDAFSQPGFAYLINHGIREETISSLFDSTKDFFELDMEVKMKYFRSHEDNSGYNPPNNEMLSGVSSEEIRESFNAYFTNPNFPDEECPKLKQHSKKLQEEIMVLLPRLFRAISVGMGLDDEEYMWRAHSNILKESGNTSTLRYLYYRPVEAGLQTGAARLGEHSDYGSITLMFQDNVGGLEIKNVNGEWIQAAPIPGSVIVIVGDLLERWSGGIYPATLHRVLVPEQEAKRRTTRQSVVYFVQQDNEFIVKPLMGSDKYEPVGSLAYLKQRLDDTYGVKY